jgi:hypothetical protein
VKDVSNTKIVCFQVAYSYDGGKTGTLGQFIAYSANVESDVKTNAFILPVFNPDNNPDKIIPLDMSELSHFFDDIKTVFNRWYPPIQNQSFSRNSMPLSRNLLEVHTVGDYKFSIVPSKKDFNKIDRNKLNVNPAAKKSIDAHSDDYSFIVYQFNAKGKLEISPFGYLSPTYSDNQLFVPTIHGHPHDGLTNIGTGYVMNAFVNYQTEFEQQAEFNHEIYGIIKADDELVTQKDLIELNNIVKTIARDYMDRDLRIYLPKKISPRKITINGIKINRNLILSDSENFKACKDLVFD